MNLSNLLKERMHTLNLSEKNLSEKALVDPKIITNILNDEITIETIDETDLAFIAKSLKCEPNYFTDESVRANDFINLSKNETLGSIQIFMNDLSFLTDIEKEMCSI